MVTPALRIGSYRVERLLGVGSFATVWLGHDPSLDARVAIKVLAENWSHDLRVRERFLDEARLLWRLDSDRVVRVHALGELDDGRPYLVMAWAGGGSLRDRLARAPVSVERGRWLLREICAGVAVLHDHGIVHRDLTPGNVLLTADPERVVIADLGLAKALAVASGLTARAGTPGYMAPEQDDPLSVVDRRADVYGLGRLGMTLLGVPPVRPGETPRLRDGVPRGIAGVLRRATARRPEDRYRDAAAFGAALDRAVRRPGRAGPLVRAALAAAAVVLLGAAVSDSVTGRFVERPGTAVDASGRVAVALPSGWRSRSGPWDPATAGGHGGSAIILSPDPARWTEPSVRGAFVGLTRTPGTTPTAFLAHRRHPGCTAEPVRAARLAGVDWLIAGFRDCPDGRSLIVEAAGTRPGAPGLAYVELVPGPDGAPAVDTLLAGVRLR